MQGFEAGLQTHEEAIGEADEEDFHALEKGSDVCLFVDEPHIEVLHPDGMCM